MKGKEVWGYSGYSGASGSLPVQVQLPTPARLLVVLSHDCEFNERKRTHFVVARIESISAKTSEEELAAMQFANDYSAAVAAEARIPLDTYYLDPVPGAFEVPMRVNFACLASLPMETAADVLSVKRAELLHEERVKFRRKAGVFFGRDADDIPDEEKQPPPPREDET
ncbi:MAG TPA: hypothetical protein VNI55_14705 [Gaiellaceae bacterium]|nr:hypothetical protein [Gaiellaceae bacterium]